MRLTIIIEVTCVSNSDAFVSVQQHRRWVSSFNRILTILPSGRWWRRAIHKELRSWPCQRRPAPARCLHRHSRRQPWKWSWRRRMQQPSLLRPERRPPSPVYAVSPAPAPTVKTERPNSKSFLFFISKWILTFSNSFLIVVYIDKCRSELMLDFSLSLSLSCIR